MAEKVEELVQDRRIVWDSSHLKQVDEAKAIIMKFKREGYKILKADGSVMERFNPRLEEVVITAQKVVENVLKILNEKGDERIVWKKEDGRAAKQAKKKFEEFLKKNYMAYSVDSRGRKNRRIHEFDVDAEEILMVPPTVKG